MSGWCGGTPRAGGLLGAVLAVLVGVLPVGPAEAAVPPNRPELTARVIELVNAERTSRGLVPVTFDRRLKRAAQKYAKLMVATGCFGHFCGGTTPGERAAAQGYTNPYLGENIFAGPRTAEQAVSGWMNSPGHRDNILNPDWRIIGVGVAMPDNGSTFFWVQVFGV